MIYARSSDGAPAVGVRHRVDQRVKVSRSGSFMAGSLYRYLAAIFACYFIYRNNYKLVTCAGDHLSMPSSIRIAFFADILVRDFDGAARTMYQIIDRKPSHVDFHLYCGVPPADDVFPFVKTATFAAPGNETYQISWPRRSRKELDASLARFAPDIIHIASPSLLGNYAVAYGNAHGIPVNTIYHTHFVSYIQYYLRKVSILVPPVEALVKRLYRRFYNRCQRIMVPTAAMLHELSAMGIAETKMVLWERGIDTRIFNPEAADQAYLGAITGNELPTILFASRLVWEKNVETLVQLHDQILQQGLAYNMVIAGEGVAKADLQGRMPAAHFVGTIDQKSLAKLYASSDVFVFTSISETFGNVVTEAMACGCPCVIANGGGTTAHIEDGSSGYLVPPGDATAYLDKIKVLIDDGEHAASVRAAGLRYTATLSWEVLAERFFSNIATLIQDNTASTETV